MTNGPLFVTTSAIGVSIASAIIVLAIPERLAPRFLAIATCLAALLALGAGSWALSIGDSGDHILWSLPVLGPIAVGATRLGSLFECISALIYIPTSIFTARYLERYADTYSSRSFTWWYGWLLAAIIALFICRDTASFFIVWEIVAVTSAALVTFEWRHEVNAKAAFLMLAMSEVGTIAAIIAVLLALAGSGTLLFSSAHHTLQAPVAWSIFLLSFFGFGVKAGLLPVNSWLPRAHPVAPGNVSALLSGVILNLGMYGIILVNLQLAPVSIAAQGVIVLIVGAASALIGILYATIEDDLKSMLAYSSIENLGIATTAFGAMLVFWTEHLELFAAIAFAATIYHITNHSAYKALLFLGAATVDARLGIRSMNRLGGVLRLLPVTGGLFFVGVLGIAAIPPLNGFTSEWLTIQALLRSAELAPLTLRMIFALCGATLALTAALAVTCFVKAFGMTFLGAARSELPQTAEAAISMRVGMALLALECVILGIFPTYVLSVIGHGVADIVGTNVVIGALVPPFFKPSAGPNPLPADFLRIFHTLGAQIGMHVPGRGWVVMLRGTSANPVVFAMSTTYLAMIIGVLLAVTYGVVQFLTRRRHATRTTTWAGGLASTLPDMTYTSTGFSNPVRVIFNAIFNPTEVQNERETIHEHFRSAIRRKRENVFFADWLLMAPAVTIVQFLARQFARIHHGRLAAYVGYALATLLIVFALATVM